MTYRRLLSAVVAALVSMTAVGAADAQLWKPKKKAAATVKKPAPRKAARAKKPARKKKSNASSVVKFGPPKDRVEDEDATADRGRDDRETQPDEDVDDNPRISVYDGDRDE